MKRYPALDIHFVPEAETAFNLRDRLLAGLDDFQPTAIEESTTTWRIYFGSRDTRGRALAWLQALGDARVSGEPLDVEDEDWARRTQADLQPVRVGRVVVTPPWSADEVRRHAADRGTIVIQVVPSMGFGTGHHASTRLCLALLQAIPLGGRSVLDIGTGSGVLAVAAAALEAAQVTAIDNDEDAIESARETLALNGVEGRVRLEQADFRDLRGARAGVVLANLTGELLRRSARDVIGCATAGADLVLSGVLGEEKDLVVAAFEAAGAELQATTTEDEWVGLHFTKSGVRSPESGVVQR